MSSSSDDQSKPNPPPYTPAAVPPAGVPPAGAAYYQPYPPGAQPYPPAGTAMPPAPQTTQPQQQTVIVVQQQTGDCPHCRVGMAVMSYTMAGICCAIWFFPCGMICCLSWRIRRCNHCGAILGD